ncbi:MAE_28990/MAE_18760 family HEPN-like nuclease [Photobacterium phosphoreum]|uniref:MAE_28990/MAE_18760 family HEPN-like nuclease n=1 Tax=Photobacterium phosphoreum TaxID=659 RepID=UPI0039B007E9
MSTFVNDYILKLDDQWSEVNLLIDRAHLVENSDLEFYNALCRSASILIVSHLEGFLKELTKNIIRDLNSNKIFKDLPDAIKRSYCKKYLGFDVTKFGNYHVLVDEMVNEFSLYENFKISHEPFLFDKNRNPKPDSIKIVLDRFGIKDIFKLLHQSIFDRCFESRTQTSYYLKRMKIVSNLSTKEYPYKASLNKFNLSINNYGSARTLWQTYLDDLNVIRHSIVHGNSFNNTVTTKQLKERQEQAYLLQLLIIYCLCSKV